MPDPVQRPPGLAVPPPIPQTAWQCEVWRAVPPTPPSERWPHAGMRCWPQALTRQYHRALQSLQTAITAICKPSSAKAEEKQRQEHAPHHSPPTLPPHGSPAGWPAYRLRAAEVAAPATPPLSRPGLRARATADSLGGQPSTAVSAAVLACCCACCCCAAPAPLAPGAAAGVWNTCVVPRPLLTATQLASGANAMPRMLAGVTPRYRRYSHTAWPAKPPPAPSPLPKLPPSPAANPGRSGDGTTENTLMLCPAVEAVASRRPQGLNCSAASGEVWARKCATTRRLAASRTTTVPATAASACRTVAQ